MSPRRRGDRKERAFLPLLRREIALVDHAGGAGPVTYFAQAANGGPIKIGMSNGGTASAQKRVADLQCGNPERLALLRVVRGNVEAALHSHFSQYRLVGEWFESCPELCDLCGALLGEPTVRDDLAREHGRGWANGAGWLAGRAEALLAGIAADLSNEAAASQAIGV